MEPRVLRLVSLKFGKDAPTEENSGLNRIVCPGESNCPEFQSQSGKDRRDKERRLCIGGQRMGNGEISKGCRAFPTKFHKEKIGRREIKLNEILEEALYWRQKRNSGGLFRESFIRSVVFDCVVLLDQYFEEFERAVRIENNKMLELLLKKPGF